MHREATTYRAAPPPAPPAVVVRAVRRRGYLGPLSLAQILIAEAVLLALVASASAGPLVFLLAGSGSAALLTVFFARRQKRWWLEHRQMTRDLRRRRGARTDPRPGPVLAALRTIAPGITVHDVTTADATVGVARDEAGWFSVVTLDPAAVPLPLDTLLGVLAGTGQPGLVLALVTHTVPAPSPDVPATSPSGASYRQLAETTGTGPVPAYRESSISLRVDARALAESLLDHTTDPEAAATLVAGLARKVVTCLRRLGVTGRLLDADRLLALLARSCDVEPWSLAGGPKVDEAWTHWRSARLVHRTYWLHTWPASATGIGALFGWASTAPAAQTSVALVLRTGPPGADDVPVRAFVRLATRPDVDLQTLDRALVEGVRRAGAQLQPLDGEQGPAAYATAPTGGGAG